MTHDPGGDKMTLRTPCCSQQIVVGIDCFDTGAVDLACWGCAGRYDVVFEGQLSHDATARWTPHDP